MMHTSWIRGISFIGICMFGLLVPRVAANETSSFTQDQLDFFELKIRPLLARHCSATSI